MKRAKKLYTLLGVLVAVCALTIVISQYEEKKEQIKNSDDIILEIASSDVKMISWEYDSNTFSFHKDDTWFYDEDETFPVNETKLLNLIDPFEELGVSFTIENVNDFGQYGLDDPVCTIQIETELKSYEILLGDYSTMDSERYVSIGDGNVYLVTDDPLSTYEKTLDDFILHDETPSFDQVNSLTFAGTENRVVTYEEDSKYTYCDDDEYFTEVDGETVPLDSDKIQDYVNAITSLSLLDYKTYNAEDKLETYGLDDPDLTITIQHAGESDNEDEFVMSISKDPKSDENDEEFSAYVRLGDSNIIYEIAQSDYESLVAVSYNDLRHEALFTADFTDITQIDIELEGNEYTITSEELSGGRYYYYQDERIEIDDLSSALAALLATEFTDENPTQKTEISFTLSLDNENYPQVKIDLYRYNGESCLATVDGETISLVDREDVVAFIEAVNDIVLN